MSPDNGLGDGGERLHEWPFPGAEYGANRQIYDEFMSTGAILAGSGSFEPAGGWGGDHHDGVPIYVLSRHPAPAWAADWPAVRYVSDVDAAMRDAKHAAGDKKVLVHGAGTAQRALTAGLLDELEIHLVPVLLGDGRRLFEHVASSRPRPQEQGCQPIPVTVYGRRGRKELRCSPMRMSRSSRNAWARGAKRSVSWPRRRCAAPC